MATKRNRRAGTAADPRVVDRIPEPAPRDDIDFLAPPEGSAPPDAPCSLCGCRTFYTRRNGSAGYVCYGCHPPFPRNNYAAIYTAPPGKWTGSDVYYTVQALRAYADANVAGYTLNVPGTADGADGAEGIAA